MPYVSEQESFTTVLIDQYYADNGLAEGWTAERVRRLCEWLQITPYELGKLCLVTFAAMKGYMIKDRFPPHISLHFALIESWWMETKHGTPQKPVMPVHLLHPEGWKGV